MVHFNDIVRALTLKVSDLGIPIYATDVKEGFSKPCFFIDIYPSNHELITSKLSKTTMETYVRFFSDTNDLASINKLIIELRKTIGRTLEVGKRVFTIKNYDIEKIEDEHHNLIIVLIFEFEYIEVVDLSEETHEQIGDVHYRTNIIY